jgi:hypothetical protein
MDNQFLLFSRKCSALVFNDKNIQGILAYSWTLQTLKMRPTRCFETLETSYPVKWRAVINQNKGNLGNAASKSKISHADHTSIGRT